MGDVGAPEINLGEVRIRTDPLIHKAGASKETKSSGPYDEITVDKIAASAAGTALHSALRTAANAILCGNKLPDFIRKLWPQINTFDDFTAAIPQPNEDLSWWLIKLGAHNQPEIDLEKQPRLKKRLEKNWTTIIEMQAVMLAGLLELHPYFNRENIIVLPEVRFQPGSAGLIRLGEALTNPTAELPEKNQLLKKTDAKPIGVNVRRALRSDSEDNLNQWLYQKLVKQQVVFTEFKDLTDKLNSLSMVKAKGDKFYPELLKLFTAGTEKEFLKKFAPALNKGNLTIIEIETLLALRLVCRAQKDMTGLLGGKEQIESKDQLRQVLAIFPLAEIDLKHEDQETTLKITRLWDNLPKKVQSIFAPVFIATDLLVLEMPEEKFSQDKAKAAFAELKTYVAEQYRTRKSPCLYQDPKFFALLTETVNHGLIIKIGDLKFSNQEIPKEINPKHRREFWFYDLVLFTALAHYLTKTHPDKAIGVFDVLLHPVARALREEFLIYCGIKYPESGNGQPLTQMAIKTAVVNPAIKNRDQKEHHLNLMHTVIKAMIAHQAAEELQPLGEVAEKALE